MFITVETRPEPRGTQVPSFRTPCHKPQKLVYVSTSYWKVSLFHKTAICRDIAGDRRSCRWSASCSATTCHGPSSERFDLVGSGSNTGPTGVPAPAVLMTVRHLQRKTVHLCPVGHHLRCVQALRAQKRRGACLRAIRTTHKRQGGPSNAPFGTEGHF